MKNPQTQALVIIMALFSGFVLPEIFEISRFRDSQGWKNRKDSFNLSTKCHQDDSKRVDCSGFNAETIGSDGCSCSCPEDSATFMFRNKTPTCIGNNRVRELLTSLAKECEHVAYFNNEKKNEPFRLLRMGESAKRTLWFGNEENLSACTPNLGTSWYIRCNDTKNPLRANNKFTLWRRKRQPRYQLQVKKVQDGDLKGGIINLKIRCTRGTGTSSRTTDHCLLFKLEGTIKCAVEDQLLSKNLSSNSTSVVVSMEKSTAEVLPFSVSTTTTTTTTILPVGTTEIHSTSTVVPRALFSAPTNPITQEQSLVASQASPGDNEELQQSGTTSHSLGVIIGVSVSLSLILLIAGFLIYRHRNSSRKRRGSTSIKKDTKDAVFMNPEVNSAFQSDEQTGYVTLGCRESTYVSACDVPNEKNSSWESNPSVSHLYDSLENPRERHSCGSRHPPQDPAGRGIHEHHTSSNVKLVKATSLYAALDTPEELHIYSPLSADEPVYNVLEEALEDQKEAIYNELEASPPDTQDGLLECFPTSAESSGACFGSSCADDPVYNVLEGSDPRSEVSDTEDEEPVYSVLDGPDVADNDGQPKYAVDIRNDLLKRGGVRAEQT